MTKAHKAEAAHLVEETRLTKVARRADATNLVVALADMNRQNPLVIMDGMLYGMCSLRESMNKNRVGPGFEEPLDDDIATDDEMACVDSDIEFEDDDEEDPKMEEATLAPTEYKD
ncbi:hypothetical protein HAX54_007110 [Datura stramonium]|uniref:Uncharacterized protein n=1 Tax=Datura stramonium TaxID=4076 RepID=A0ABS8WX49_DATST|nr:hypothetical protein [Datura stramonium]